MACDTVMDDPVVVVSNGFTAVPMSPLAARIMSAAVMSDVPPSVPVIVPSAAVRRAMPPVAATAESPSVMFPALSKATVLRSAVMVPVTSMSAAADPPALASTVDAVTSPTPPAVIAPSVNSSPTVFV